MSKVIIYPYKMGSVSSKQLRDRLGATRVYPDRAYRYRDGDLVINWGNSHSPNWDNSDVKWLNKPNAVRNASNKLNTFKKLEANGIKIPFYTQSKYVAIDNFDKIVVRHVLDGHSGEGIEVVDASAYGVPEAPLYTQYIPAKAEYRIHVFDGNVIDISKKVRDDGEEDDGWTYSEPTEEEMMIKSHKNGWTFARGGIKFNPELGRIAIKSLKSLELDFGAVDIIRGEDDEYYVLEVNTAVGCAETTLNSYTTAIMNYLIKNN